MLRVVCRAFGSVFFYGAFMVDDLKNADCLLGCRISRTETKAKR